jgi:hypothetical protein
MVTGFSIMELWGVMETCTPHFKDKRTMQLATTTTTTTKITATTLIVAGNFS